MPKEMTAEMYLHMFRLTWATIRHDLYSVHVKDIREFPGYSEQGKTQLLQHEYEI